MHHPHAQGEREEQHEGHEHAEPTLNTPCAGHNKHKMQQVAPRLVIKRIIVLEGIVNRGRLLRRLLRRLGLLLGLRSRHAGRGNVIVARRLEGVRLVRRLRFTAASQPYRLLGRSSSRSGLLGRSRRHASSHIVRISVELATLLESGVLAHDEAREDAEEDADRAHNDAHQKHLALTVGAAEDHRHRATRSPHPRTRTRE